MNPWMAPINQPWMTSGIPNVIQQPGRTFRMEPFDFYGQQSGQPMYKMDEMMNQSDPYRSRANMADLLMD